METEEESGTTLVTFILKKFPAVLLVADRQATPPEGAPIAKQKIYELERKDGRNIGISMCGDAYHGRKMIDKLKDYMKVANDLRVEDYARELIQIERRRPVNRRTHFFLSGYDEDEEGVLQPHVFVVSKGGLFDVATTKLETADNSFWLGSGGRYAYPYYNTRFNTDMSIAPAVELAGNAVCDASIHCPHTGMGLQVMLIRPHKEIVTWTREAKSLRRQFRRSAVH